MTWYAIGVREADTIRKALEIAERYGKPCIVRGLTVTFLSETPRYEGQKEFTINRLETILNR